MQRSQRVSLAFYGFASVCIFSVLIFLAARAISPTTGSTWKIISSLDRSNPRPTEQDVAIVPTPSAATNESSDVHHQQQAWTFEYKRDRRNYGLSEEQCNAAFPKLYYEIDRAVQHRQDVGQNITLDDLDWRGITVRCMIRHNQLYIIEAKGVATNFRPRAMATLNTLNRAVMAYPYGDLPNVEFTLTVDDYAAPETTSNSTIWGYARHPDQEDVWLMPDFGFWGWPGKGTNSYPEHVDIIEQMEPSFLDKIPKIVWRGGLHNAGRASRKALLRECEGKEFCDVASFRWHDEDAQEKRLSMQEHCGYMMAAQTEGNTYSGRLKLLLNCHNIVISHPLKYREHFTHLLQSDGPEQNYVELDKKFSTLTETMERLLGSTNIFGIHTEGTLESEGLRIADNARATFRERYLTPAAEACYWRALVRGWKKVQGFEPELWVDAGQGEGMAGKKPRGVPYEAFAIMEDTEWEVPPKSRYLAVEEDD